MFKSLTGAHGPTVKTFGLTELSSPQAPLVDIVFVHGLNGNPQKSWSLDHCFWPRDLLPEVVEDQRVRVLTYGYDANVSAFIDGVSKDKIHNLAEQLIASLCANRSLRKAMERPILFVCHSLGGLVVKRALIASAGMHKNTKHLRSIYISTYGILFFGTPHKGSNLAKWAGMLESIARVSLPKKFFDTSPRLLETLKKENETLQNIDRLFVDIMSRFHIFFFHETKPSDLKIGRHLVVEEESAAPTLDGVERMGIQADHKNMCKFANIDSPGFEAVAEAISRYAANAPPVIARRWKDEKKRLYDEAKAVAMEEIETYGLDNDAASPTASHAEEQKQQSTLPGNTNISLITSRPFSVSKIQVIGSIPPMSPEPDPLSDPSAPLLVAPDGFRPNSAFFGMQKELRQLHERLFNPQKRDMGTASVVIWSRAGAGAGKTHLARQYVYTHRQDFPNGIFWVDAKSLETLRKSFWDIAQQTALKRSQSPVESCGQEATKDFIEAVKKWFEMHDNWLLVFDGLSLSDDSDIVLFQNFLPDSKNSSIIYTARDRGLAGKQRLLDPLSVKVHPLSEDDAKALLYEGLGIKRPSPDQDAKATEIVKYLECLPLAIHAIAHRLNATGKALEKYNISSYSTDSRLAVIYQGIMNDLKDNGHFEAIDLIYLLSFFDHEVPVTMLHLGSKALKDLAIDVRSTESGGLTKDMETTFAILIKYGLIDRAAVKYDAAVPNEQTIKNDEANIETRARYEASDRVSDSRQSLDNSSSSSVARTIDILKTHSVVQSYFHDFLRHDMQFYYWLRVATNVFCKSFEKACQGVKTRGTTGLARDFREFDTHGARLLGHFPKSAMVLLQENLIGCRDQLRIVQHQISDEITRTTRQSSQDNLRGPPSIFDRSGSFSASSASGADTPEAMMCFWDQSDALDSDNPQYTSPASTTSQDNTFHGDKQARLSYHPVLAIEDRGYESDRDIPSRQSATVPSDFSNLVPEDLRHLWQQHIERKDLGSFRPVPLGTRTTRIAASGVVAGHAQEFSSGKMTGSSAAETMLTAMHHASPPPSRGNRKISPSRYASMKVEGETSSLLQETLNPSALHAQHPPSKSIPTPTPQRAALAPHPSPGFAYSRSASSERLPANSNSKGSYLISYSQFQRSNMSSRLHSRSRSFSHSQHRPGAKNLLNYGYYATTVPVPSASHTPPTLIIPPGYTSQPMSRNPSGQSYNAASSSPDTDLTHALPNTLSPPPSANFTPPVSHDLAHLTFGTGSWVSEPVSEMGTTDYTPRDSLTLGGAPFMSETLRFGQQTPLNVAETRLRVEREREEARRRRSHGGTGESRPGSRTTELPYPTVNLIPTESDISEIERLVENDVSREDEFHPEFEDRRK